MLASWRLVFGILLLFDLYWHFYLWKLLSFLAYFVFPNQEFEVMTTPLDTDVLHGIREKIASFIMNQVISEKGEFHCRNLGLNISLMFLL